MVMLLHSPLTESEETACAALHEEVRSYAKYLNEMFNRSLVFYLLQFDSMLFQTNAIVKDFGQALVGFGTPADITTIPFTYPHNRDRNWSSEHTHYILSTLSKVHCLATTTIRGAEVIRNRIEIGDFYSIIRAEC